MKLPARSLLALVTAVALLTPAAATAVSGRPTIPATRNAAIDSTKGTSLPAAGSVGQDASADTGASYKAKRNARMQPSMKAPRADEVVVSLTSARISSAISAAASAKGGRVSKQSRDGRRLLVKVPVGDTVRGFAAKMKTVPGVRDAEAESFFQASATPTDPGWEYQWGPAKIGATAAWDVTKGAASVTIAVIDSGVDLDHPELVAAVDTTNDYDFINGDAIADDDNGHGTHVAGIAAAAMNNGQGIAGMAPASRVLPVKVLDEDGWGNNFAIADGIFHAVDAGADVINMSLGGGYSAAVAEAVQYAIANNVVVIAATGNGGKSGVDYPARYPGVIGVGATNPTDGRVAFSNYGDGVDLVAPGVNIVSTVPGGYEYMNGTSMATPFVAGTAALLRAQNPSWTAQQVASRLTSTALDLGPSGKDAQFGYGRLRAAEALGRTSPPVSAPTFDDDLPGVPVTGSPITGTLAGGSDSDDIYSIDLKAGDRLTLSLDGAAGTDFDVYLYDPSVAEVASSTALSYPEEIDYLAVRGGTYYIDLWAWSGAGSGDYTLTYSVTSTRNDWDVPGMTLPGATVGGELTDMDAIDVYAVTIPAGQRLSASLTGAAGTDFDMQLFAPGTKTIYNDWSLAAAARSTYPETLTYKSGISATYYLAVYSWEGTGTYVLNTAIAALQGDDKIPGVALPSVSPLKGSLSLPSDVDDVYSVPLADGQYFYAELSASPLSTAYSAYLFPPSATNLDVAVPVAGSVEETYPQTIDYFVAPGKGGKYYLDLYNWWGSGEYQLKWLLGKTAPQITTTAKSATISYGATTYVSGVLRDAAGRPIPGRKVALQTSKDGKTFYTSTVTATTGSTGGFKLAYKPSQTTYLRARFAGDTGYAAAQTTAVKIVPKAYLTTPTAPSSIYYGRSFTSYGYLKPRHTSGTYAVKIAAYRYQSGKWVYKKSFSAKVSNYSSYSKFTGSVKLPYRGKWRIRAYHADSGHAATYSSYRYVTVK